MRDLADPDIRLAGLSIWVLRYQYPDETEYWDANWVEVYARYITQGARVEHRGPCLHVPELVAWARACDRLRSGGASHAALEAMEPNLRVSINRDGDTKGLRATVRITPDQVLQDHEFRLWIDESSLTPLIESLRTVLGRFPVRGHTDT